MYRYTKVAAAGLLFSLVAASAYSASQTSENDAAAISGAKITLSQAISAAEQHVQGKAARAELEHSKGKLVFDVEVVNGAKTFDVKVDPEKGTVLASTEDKTEHDDGNDQDD